MKFLLYFALFFMNSITVFAYEVVITEVREPYEVVPLLGDLEEKKVLLGRLDNFPVMYEAVVGASTTLSMQLAQRYQEVPLGLSVMIVRVDNGGGGVTEVARASFKAADWQMRNDSILGMSFLESEYIHTEIGEGTYRIEVSTPDNLGSYLLMVGEIDAPLGYRETLHNVRLVQKNFDYSVFAMVRSSYVYYPLAILCMSFLLLCTWKYRKLIVHGK